MAGCQGVARTRPSVGRIPAPASGGPDRGRGARAGRPAVAAARVAADHRRLRRLRRSRLGPGDGTDAAHPGRSARAPAGRQGTRLAQLRHPAREGRPGADRGRWRPARGAYRPEWLHRRRDRGRPAARLGIGAADQSRSRTGRGAGTRGRPGDALRHHLRHRRHGDGHRAAPTHARRLEHLRPRRARPDGGARHGGALRAAGHRPPRRPGLLPLHRRLERGPDADPVPVPAPLSGRTAAAHPVGADGRPVVPQRPGAQGRHPGPVGPRVPEGALAAGRRRRPARPGDLRRVRRRPPGQRGGGGDPAALPDPVGAGRWPARSPQRRPARLRPGRPTLAVRPGRCRPVAPAPRHRVDLPVHVESSDASIRWSTGAVDHWVGSVIARYGWSPPARRRRRRSRSLVRWPARSGPRGAGRAGAAAGAEGRAPTSWLGRPAA